MDKKNGLDYSKVTEEEISKAEQAKEENKYDIMGLLKEIVEKDSEVGGK